MSNVIKERKLSQSASCKIDTVVQQLFLPMLQMTTPSHTSFQPEDSDDALMRQISQEKPEAVKTEEIFVEYMVELYRKFQVRNV